MRGGFYAIRTAFKRLWAQQDAERKRRPTLLDLAKITEHMYDESAREANKRMRELDAIIANMPWGSAKNKTLVYKRSRRRKCATA